MTTGVTVYRLAAAALFICLTPDSNAATTACKPTQGASAVEVLRTCGQPKKRHAVRWRGMDIVHREWDYGDTIVGLIDERVAYVFDLTN